MVTMMRRRIKRTKVRRRWRRRMRLSRRIRTRMMANNLGQLPRERV
jgi:hypothetical protein